MFSRSHFWITTALVVGTIAPATAQQSLRHYLTYFKYSDAAIKAMTENPMDREAAARKLAEGFGGKLDAIYWTTSGAYDGFAVFEYPDDVTAEASNALTRATGNFQRIEAMPILTADELKAAMQKVKDVKATTAYTAPTQTK
ncbi:MAG: GYD domain-containing protein [Roseiarcus sp.]